MPVQQSTKRNFLKALFATIGAGALLPVNRLGAPTPPPQEIPIQEVGAHATLQSSSRADVMKSHFKSGSALTRVLDWAAEGAANVVEFGAAGDGVSDDSAAIQKAVANHALIYFPPGIYVCNDVNIPTDRCLTSSSDVTLLATKAGSFALNLRGSGITLHNLKFEGQSEEKLGVMLDLDIGDLADILFEQCIFTNLAVAIAFKAATQMGRTARNITVTGCTFDDIELKAIDMTVSTSRGGVPYALDNIHIEKNTFSDIAEERSGVRQSGNYSGALYIGGLSRVSRFYLSDNVVERAGPQFLAMSATEDPRIDFVVRGNIVRQQGTTNVVHMSYSFNNVENLLFSDNSSYFVEFEHVYLDNCRNFKVSNCHFEDANVGVAVIDKGSGHHSWGEISNCTFVDIECPTDANNGNKAIYVSSDSADVDISNCRFLKNNGTKVQVGINVRYANVGAKWAKAFDTATYQWLPDGVGHYYLVGAQGGNPEIPKPIDVYESGNELVAGAMESLGAGQWTWGDNHALGYNTIYVQLSDSAAPENNRISAGYPRPSVNINNCRFERLTGIVVSSGGSLNYPGHASVMNCSFKKCATAIRFTYPVGNVVAFCSFESCTTDVHIASDVNGLRCVHNLHINTNPDNGAGAGAYLIDLGLGSSIWEVSGCTFRNVKNIQVVNGGTAANADLGSDQRVFIFRDNGIDTLSTGNPNA